jgi:ubiquinone/menaquinone biosynthesis C-methylase UbiE
MYASLSLGYDNVTILLASLKFCQPNILGGSMVDKTSEGLRMSGWTTKRRAKERYDLTAQMYDELYAEEQEAKYETAFCHLDSELNGLVLDLGCGSGLLFWHLGNRAQEIVGVDLSRNLLRKAQKEAAKVHVKVSLIQADADFLPFIEGLFGTIFAFTVLQNMPEPLETLREAKRVMKPDAEFVISGLKKAFPFEEFKRVLGKVGFSLVSVNDDDSLKCYVAVVSQFRA